MANVPDNIKAWSFIKKLQDNFTIISDKNDELQALKTSWQDAGIDTGVEGFPLTPQEVSAANTLIVAMNTFMTDNAAVIDGLLAKNVGSHKGNALD